MNILYFFLFLWVIFALLDPDPDPATQINADPSGYGSRSETLVFLVLNRNRGSGHSLSLDDGEKTFSLSSWSKLIAKSKPSVSGNRRASGVPTELPSLLLTKAEVLGSGSSFFCCYMCTFS